MRVAVELEFPDEQAATAFQWLQSIPNGLIVRLQSNQQFAFNETGLSIEVLSEAEQHRLLHEVFGSWKSEESGDEMARRIYADRQDQPREVDL